MHRRLLALGLVFSVTQVSAQTPAFEAASVKPNASGAAAQSGRMANGSVTMTNMRVRALIVTAYGSRPERIAGAPSWIDEARYDITAKAPAGTPDNQLPLMLRTLLTDRFKLVARTEMREQPVYALVMVRPGGTPGPSLRPSTECESGGAGSGIGGPPLPAGKRACGVISGSDGKAAYIIGGARSMELLARALQNLGLIERPVIDRTGLTGTYDFDLRFSAAPLASSAADVPLPSIFTAVQEQLGLRLEPARGPVEFLVIDSIERPTAD
ncbi:MAG TPA: TIGR03435 family protein [Actinomycetota bacterium]|nr:TIGR03435 family protein [Actinomycetota bacterium]